MSEAPIFLKGEKIYLRGLKAEDFGPTMISWLNDRDVTRFLVRGTFPGNLELLRKEYDLTISNRDEVQFAVCELMSNRCIGIAGLHGIHPTARHAEFRILIGEKSTWGQGYGTEALFLLTAYGFEILNLNKVWLGVNTGNDRAYKSYKKVGFVTEGELRDEVYRNGRYFNVARMSLLRSEYEKMKEQWKIASLLNQQFRQSP